MRRVRRRRPGARTRAADISSRSDRKLRHLCRRGRQGDGPPSGAQLSGTAAERSAERSGPGPGPGRHRLRDGAPCDPHATGWAHAPPTCDQVGAWVASGHPVHATGRMDRPSSHGAWVASGHKNSLPGTPSDPTRPVACWPGSPPWGQHAACDQTRPASASGLGPALGRALRGRRVRLGDHLARLQSLMAGAGEVPHGVGPSLHPGRSLTGL